MVGILDDNLKMTQFAIPSSGNQISIYDSTTGVLFYSLAGHSEPVIALAFFPSDNYLASGASDGFIKIWRKKILTISIDTQNHVTSLAALSNGYLAAGFYDGYIKLYDISNGNFINNHVRQ